MAIGVEKSPEAFRTISEVSDELGVPAHVLRFWESRFTQIKPVKRAGGRRYYRPEDLVLIAGIQRLLHEEGLTIRGVQKILRERGIQHVIAIGLGEEMGTAYDAPLRPTAMVRTLRPRAAREPSPIPDPIPEPGPAPEPEPEPDPAPGPDLPVAAGKAGRVIDAPQAATGLWLDTHALLTRLRRLPAAALPQAAPLQSRLLALRDRMREAG
ncbi:MerR family transcriptional regulator [Haematobacter massiliensis]|uniref:MerR family transcriptional regulator n=1 Tax=Haematobacter massiliensis TaxID=195105 RepID=UPI000B33DEF6